MKVTILGCGSSAGVPVIGCDCPVCTSTNPKNNRTRVSLFIETPSANILIDTSPDLRQQALRENIRRVDALLYTHDHADHAHGIDEMRNFNYLKDAVIPAYGSAETLGGIMAHFPYAFRPRPATWVYPALAAHKLESKPVVEFTIGDLPVVAFEQQHGRTKSTGYRFGKLAYSTDTDTLPETAFKALEGVDTWIVDCLRLTKSHGHSTLENTLNWIKRVKPRRAILTHMAHDLDYEKLAAELPPGIEPAYDGMQIHFD